MRLGDCSGVRYQWALVRGCSGGANFTSTGGGKCPSCRKGRAVHVCRPGFSTMVGMHAKHRLWRRHHLYQMPADLSHTTQAPLSVAAFTHLEKDACQKVHGMRRRTRGSAPFGGMEAWTSAGTTRFENTCAGCQTKVMHVSAIPSGSCVAQAITLPVMLV